MAGQKGNTNKPIDEDILDIQVNIRFSKKEIEEIEKIAEELELPKTRLIRNLALAGLADAKTLNKIGILKGAKKLLDFKDRFSNPKKYPSFEALA
ncbi:MAG: hypothetical protein QG567_615 [Campylobacterota bacterium]|nr:hypothetical protein [Campylobacterota bacterium]